MSNPYDQAYTPEEVALPQEVREMVAAQRMGHRPDGQRKTLAYLEQENSVLHSKLRSLEMKLEKAEKALAVEREACAKVAEDVGRLCGQGMTGFAAAQSITNIIRARGEK